MIQGKKTIKGKKTLDKMSRKGVVFNKLRENKVLYDRVSEELGQLIEYDISNGWQWLPKICLDIMNRPPHNAPADYHYSIIDIKKL